MIKLNENGQLYKLFELWEDEDPTIKHGQVKKVKLDLVEPEGRVGRSRTIYIQTDNYNPNFIRISDVTGANTIVIHKAVLSKLIEALKNFKE